MAPAKAKRTRVIFRVWKDTGEVIALFPDLLADHYGHITSYQHIGQHSAATYSVVIGHTTPATPEQYADLLKELTDLVGYENLHPVSRK